MGYVHNGVKLSPASSRLLTRRQLRGAPVLFLPGNAGSYKQVRSYAAEASNYYNDVLRHSQDAMRDGVRGLDFFMVDFNEDLAAFHGQTVLDQADYVNEAIAFLLSLYHDPQKVRRDPSLPDPSSVILIGHSMGGLVARTALTRSNYQSNSVNTIITMSTPHARPPVSFDSDMVNTYQTVNEFWRHAYSQKWASDNPLWHVTLVSIAGGGNDTVVPSDYASISSLVPETHGFTVFTSTIPQVWTSMDHLAITWCDSFRRVVARSLYDIIDVRRPVQTKQRADRIRILKQRYLTGLEESSPKALTQGDPTTLLTLGERLVPRESRISVSRLGSDTSTRATLLPLLPTESTGTKFVLLTNQGLDSSRGNDKLEVLFCSAFPLQQGHSPTFFPEVVDLSDGSPDSTRLACKTPSKDVIHLPASTRASKYPFEQGRPFAYLEYNAAQTQDHQFVAILDKANEPTDGWLVAETINTTDSTITVDTSLWRLIVRGVSLHLAAGRPLVTDIHIPALHSSLLAYKLVLGNRGCGDETALFTPLLRQYLSGPYESKYFVNVKEANINLHGIAPFMPSAARGRSLKDGVSFQLWSDPNCKTTMDVLLKVDIRGSLGKLVMRYRTVFAAFPLLVVALVLGKQFRIYNDTGVFITFAEGLDQCIRSSLPVFLLALIFFGIASASGSSFMSPGNRFLSHWHVNATVSVVEYATNDLLLGSQDSFFWFLVPVFGVISIGAVVAVNYALLAIINVFSPLHQYFLNNAGGLRHSDQTLPNVFVSSTPTRRIINTGILLLLVSTIIPYQFAYVVSCVVQLATTTRAFRFAGETRSASQSDFFNYTFSLLNLMVWILPINMLVLVVWVHNLALHWLMPFESHHNVLSIMPLILLVETLSGGNMIPRVPGPARYTVSLSFFALAITAALYGVTYAYRLHHMVNGIALLLQIAHLSASPRFSFRGLRKVLEGDLASGAAEASIEGGDKKIP